MVRLAAEKAGAHGDAAAAGTGRFLFVTCAAEELSAPEQAFDLVTIGNAFHRLPREAVARGILGWLKPGGFLALLWGGPMPAVLAIEFSDASGEVARASRATSRMRSRLCCASARRNSRSRSATGADSIVPTCSNLGIGDLSNWRQ